MTTMVVDQMQVKVLGILVTRMIKVIDRESKSDGTSQEVREEVSGQRKG